MPTNPKPARLIRTAGLRLTRRQISKLQSHTPRKTPRAATTYRSAKRNAVRAADSKFRTSWSTEVRAGRRVPYVSHGKFTPGGWTRNCGIEKGINPKSFERARVSA